MNKTFDKRISPRKTIRTRVIFEDEFSEGFLYFLSTDISISGIFIESIIELKIGSKLLIRFSLYEGDEPITVTGEVARLTSVKRGPGRRKKNQVMGIGIRYIGLKLSDLQRIEKFIES